MFRDITKMSSGEIIQYLKEIKLEEEKEKAEKALNELYEQYKDAEYIYEKSHDNLVAFAKIKGFEFGKSSGSKFNDIVYVRYEKYFVINGIKSEESINLVISEYNSWSSTLIVGNTKVKEQIISKEAYDSLVEKFIKIKSSINLNDFTI